MGTYNQVKDHYSHRTTNMWQLMDMSLKKYFKEQITKGKIKS